jgi:hypothetical protein
MYKILTVVLSMVVLFCISNQAIAKLYKWIDQSGVVHFSDTPPANGQKAEIHTPSKDPESLPASVLKKSREPTQPDRKVAIYTTSW